MALRTFVALIIDMHAASSMIEECYDCFVPETSVERAMMFHLCYAAEHCLGTENRDSYALTACQMMRFFSNNEPHLLGKAPPDKPPM